MNIGKRIAEIRKENNLSQEELANKIYVSPKTISSWEVGRTLPSVDNLMAISDALNIKIDTLLYSKEIRDEYIEDGKRNKALKIFYLIILLLVPAIFFSYIHHVGYNYLAAHWNAFKDFSDKDIINTHNIKICVSICYYIIYVIMQVINYLIYQKKNSKILILATIIESIAILLINIPYGFSTFELLILLIFVPITNIFLYFISKK